MKLFLLVRSRLAQYFLSNKLIFSLFVLGSFVCGLSFIFVYGNYLSIMRYQSNSENGLRSYKVEFPESITVDRINLSALQNIEDFSEESFDEIQIISTLGIDDMSFSDQSLIPDDWVELMNKGSIKLITYVKKSDKMYPIQGRCAFTEQEQLTGASVIVAPDDLLETAKRELPVYIRSKPYKIIGITNVNRFVIPIQTFEANGYKAFQLQFVLNQIPDLHANQSLTVALQTLYPDAKVFGTDIQQQKLYRKMLVELPQIALFYICSLFSFLFLMKYMIDLNVYENIIYAMLGASRKKVISILMIEIVVLVALTSIFSIVFHFLAYQPIFNKLNTVEGIIYSGYDYLIIFFVSLVAATLTSLPFVWRYARISLISNKNRYTAI